MPLSVHQSSVGVYQVTLAALSAILDKAAEHAAEAKFDPAVYLTLRLTPNMLPFVKQVQLCSDHAKRSCARLAGVEAPPYEDNEASLDELKARLAKTSAYIGSLDKDAIEAGAAREITMPLGPNKARMRGDNYLLHFALPNYYFHLATAYDLLRQAGVNIGKRDFVGAVPGFELI